MIFTIKTYTKSTQTYKKKVLETNKDNKYYKDYNINLFNLAVIDLKI
jgi:hypothetical protein